MKTVRRVVLASLILLAAGIAFDVWRQRGTSGVQPATSSTPRPPGEKASIWTGSPSCVGRSCHGGLEPPPDGNCLQNEYTTIATQDPHARAYQVLFNQRSQDMVRTLGYAHGKAHEVTRCLACHASPLAIDEFGPAPPALRTAEVAFGVGCESCHGPAVGWIDRHYEKGWKPHRGLSAVKTKGWDPRELDRAETRAATCAECHVGTPASESFAQRSVDHDLIAAGHPRLLFEFVSLQAAMPPHWKPKPRDLPLDWFVGQMEGAKASLRLLRQRARTPAAPWPEFAEFDCFACHHDLRAKSWRQRPSATRAPGALPWDSWNYAVITRLLAQQTLPTDDWRKLREVMAKGDRQAVLAPLQRAEASLDELAKFAPQWSRDKGGTAKLLDFVKNPDWASAESWEAAEQYFFALRALKAASDDPDLARRIDELERRRGFDAEFTSPRRFDPGEFFKK